MRALVQGFPAQLEEAIAIGAKAQLQPNTQPIHQVVVNGLGGSGIGGTIVSELVADSATVPILTNKDYSIPGFVGPQTLMLISSYSGNTEETLEAFDKALAKQANIACVTSGGKVKAKADEHQLNHIVIPGGLPPRSAFGYSFAQLFYVLNHYGIIDMAVQDTLTEANEWLKSQQAAIEAEANTIADQLMGKIPVLYSDGSIEGVAWRWRQQINENSKMLCWHHVYPEMNHNELVGWTTRNEDLAVVFLRNENDYARTQKRMEITRATYEQHTDTIIDLYSKGANAIQRALYLIHLGDWVSVVLAEKKGIDPVEVDVITNLKDALAEF